jgi:hypothetical protein
MRRILTRFSILLVLATALLWISSTNDARAFDCVNLSAMWDEMGACDSGFWTGASPYHDVVNNNPDNCDTQAANQCQSLLGQPGYAVCYSTAYSNCVNTVETNYYEALSTYSSCLNEAVNPSCFEELEFCPGAIDRANQCAAFENEECCAYSDCLSASGIWQCQ